MLNDALSCQSRPAQAQREQRRRGGDTVDPVKHPTVPREEAAAVFDARGALEHADGKVADDRQAGDSEAKRYEYGQVGLGPGRPE